MTTEIAKLSVLTLDNSRTEIPIIIEFELEIYKDLSSLFFNSEEYKKAHIEKISKIMEVLKKEKIDIKNGYYEE